MAPPAPRPLPYRDGGHRGVEVVDLVASDARLATTGRTHGRLSWVRSQHGAPPANRGVLLVLRLASWLLSDFARTIGHHRSSSFSPLATPQEVVRRSRLCGDCAHAERVGVFPRSGAHLVLGALTSSTALRVASPALTPSLSCHLRTGYDVAKHINAQRARERVRLNILTVDLVALHEVVWRRPGQSGGTCQPNEDRLRHGGAPEVTRSRETHQRLLCPGTGTTLLSAVRGRRLGTPFTGVGRGRQRSNS